MNFLCLVLSHKIDILYNDESYQSKFRYRDVIGCSRCRKVWYWYIYDKEKEIEK